MPNGPDESSRKSQKVNSFHLAAADEMTNGATAKGSADAMMMIMAQNGEAASA